MRRRTDAAGGHRGRAIVISSVAPVDVVGELLSCLPGVGDLAGLRIQCGKDVERLPKPGAARRAFPRLAFVECRPTPQGLMQPSSWAHLITLVTTAPSHVAHRRQLEAGHVAGAQHRRCCDYGPLALLVPVLPDQELEDPDNGVGQNDQHYKLYDEIRGMKVEWHDHKIALLGVVSMSVAIRVQHVGFDAGLLEPSGKNEEKRI